MNYVLLYVTLAKLIVLLYGKDTIYEVVSVSLFWLFAVYCLLKYNAWPHI